MTASTGAFAERTGNRWAKIFTDTITLAFRNDPTWSPKLRQDLHPEIAHTYWEFFVRSAQRYPWMGTLDNGAAVSVWLPPGADELTEEEERRFPELAQELLGREGADELFKTIERFDAARPDGDYFYLSLLATHPSRRGEGLGMKLLQQNLAHIDQLETPSYLESSNPANNERYQRLGYQPHGTITLPSGFKLMTLWRDPTPQHTHEKSP